MPPGINLAAVSDALKTLSSIGQLVPVAGETIAGALELASQICEIAQDVKDSKHALHQLAISAGLSLVEITKIIQTAEEAKWPEYESHVAELNTLFQEIKKTAADVRKSGIMSRVLSRRKVKQTITDLDDLLAKSCARFGIYEALRNKITSDGLVNLTRSVVDYQRETLAVVRHTQVTAEMLAERVLLDKLNPVAASWNSDVVSTSTSSCLAETRVRLLEDITHWAFASPSETSPLEGALSDAPTSDAPPAIFWLSGLAGTGKSTIARTVCELVTAQSAMLCASFFFSRQSTERHDPSRVACSLAFQIALGDDSLRAKICKVVRENLDITTLSIAEQIRLLLAEPLQACAPLARPIVIVLDALDESDMRDGKEGGALLPGLAAAIRRPHVFPSVRLFVTSRSEPSIRAMFHELNRDAPHQVVQLHEIEHSIVRQDIIRYLESRLRIIPTKIPDLLPRDWPEQADLVALAARAGVLFVYAATLVRFIDSELDNPSQQLRSILDDTVGDSDAVYGAVDDLYLQILDHAVRSEKDAGHRHCRRLRDVLGFVILIREPLSVDYLSRIVGMEAANITLVLRQLTAVLIVPESGPITVFHPSFTDFITDARRCADTRFRIEPSLPHTLLAQKCLQFMNQHLRRDICGIQNPSLLNTEVDNLPERLHKAVPPEVAYACQYWTAHLSFAACDDSLIRAELVQFSRGKILYWVELLSLMGMLHSSFAMLDIAQSYVAAGSSFMEAAILMKDTDHMIREFYPAIRASALHVYYSAVPLMPKSRLFELTEHEAKSSVCLLSQRSDGWCEELLRSFQSHGDRADILAFIEKGSRLLCVSTLDYKGSEMEILDIATGERLPRLSQSPTHDWNSGEGRLKLWYSATSKTSRWSTIRVIISPDGRWVLDKTKHSARLLNAHNGELQAIFGDKEKKLKVKQVRFSSDGECIICVYTSGEVHFWDIGTGDLISRIEQLYPSNKGWAITSLDTEVIGTIFYDDGYVGPPIIPPHRRPLAYKAWSTRGAPQPMLHLDQSWLLFSRVLNSATFSQNGEIVCWHQDGILYLWNLNTGAFLGKLEKPPSVDYYYNVCISGNAKRVAAEYESILFVWDTVTMKLVAQLVGHGLDIDNVCISEDGFLACSHALDGSVCVWDVSRKQDRISPEVRGIIIVVSISDNGDHIVTASDDMITVWSRLSGAEVLLMPIPDKHDDFGRMRCATISGDGSRVMTARLDKDNRSAHIWDATTGKYMLRLRHREEVLFGTLSEDGDRGALICNDEYLYVWNIRSGNLLSEILLPETRPGSPPRNARLSPDGLHVATHFRSNGPEIVVFDTLSGQMIASLSILGPGPTHTIEDMTVKYSGNLLHAIINGRPIGFVDTWNRSADYQASQEKSPVMFTNDLDTASYWLWSQPSGAEPMSSYRVCWLPPRLHPNKGRWKTIDTSSQGNTMVIGSAAGRFTVLDFTAVRHWEMHAMGTSL